MRSTILGTLTVGTALLIGGCTAIDNPEAEQYCAKLGASYSYAWRDCRVNGWQDARFRLAAEDKKLECVRAGGVPVMADRYNGGYVNEYWAGCPLDESVQCYYEVPTVSCNAKVNEVNVYDRR